MEGGGEKIIPLYKEQRNSPYITNEQRDNYTNKMNEMKNQPPVDPNKGMNQIVNLQVAIPKKQSDQSKTSGPTFFAQPNVPNPYYPPQYGYMAPQGLLYPQLNQPVVNTYNINVEGMGNHGRMNLIYEHMLPTINKRVMGTLLTLGERNEIYNYMRVVMFPDGDGSNKDLDGKGSDSLLSHLNMMDLNPYNTYKLSPNPYKGLPDNFLIFRSCYPIRYDQEAGNTICAKNSLGANIRIYKLTIGSTKFESMENLNKLDYEEWREVLYYKYVRDNILNKFVSPNFVMIYGFYISEKCNIDFDKILQIKGIYKPKEQLFMKYQKELPQKVIPKPLFQSGGSINPKNIVNLNDINYEMKLNPKAYFNKALVVLTESPTYNLFGWCSRIAERSGNILRETQIGYHSDNVWTGILFQIMSALYVMQIHKICFYDFKPEDNIFVRDLKVDGLATKFWKYKINGVEYYIPNHGYLVMIDSCYKNLPSDQNAHKIYANAMNDIVDYDTCCFNHFLTVFNVNNFKQSFINDGGYPPSPKILSLIDRIHNDAINDKKKDISKYFKYMYNFINNRVGTLLTENEIQYKINSDKTQIKKGDILIYEDSLDYYKFVLFIESKNNGIATILTKDKDDQSIFIEKNVPITNLFQYGSDIQQKTNSEGMTFNYNDLIETYIIN